MCSPFQNHFQLSVVILWSPGLCRNKLGISTLNSLLTVQFNVPQKCYEFKPNTELIKDVCKCYEMKYVISHEIGVWMFGFFVAIFLDNTGE